MKLFLNEVDENFLKFTDKWAEELESSRNKLSKNKNKYRDSYRRLVSLQAWRSELLEASLSKGSLGFFLEAQNDALVSHVFAHFGAWRPALQSLRSCIENSLYCLYYMDHPVELELWRSGRHRLSFSKVYDYLLKHPLIDPVSKNVTGLDLLKKEYETLSKAVHASAESFRMTSEDEGTNLWISADNKLNQWQTRERNVITGINLILLTMFKKSLQGTALQGLRKAIGLSLSESRAKSVKTHLKINIPRK